MQVRIGKYRKRPIVIQAVQWNGPADDALIEIARWGCEVEPNGAWDAPDWPLIIPTLEGRMRCVVGDWIIRGVQGEFYPCKPDIFEATYEPEAR